MISYLDSSSINYLFYDLASMFSWGAYRSVFSVMYSVFGSNNNVCLLLNAHCLIFIKQLHGIWYTVHGAWSRQHTMRTTHLQWATGDECLCILFVRLPVRRYSLFLTLHTIIGIVLFFVRYKIRGNCFVAGTIWNR